MIKKMVGTTRIDGIHYAVISRDEGPASRMEYFELRRANNLILVSRIFSEDAEVEGIQTIKKTYAFPHWITTIGQMTIHWLNNPVAIEVLDENPVADIE